VNHPSASSSDADHLDEPAVFDPRAGVDRRQGAYLPHWSQESATYFVTFRLADSLPAAVLDGWRAERRQRTCTATDDGLTPVDEQRLLALFADRIERHLDAGHGACCLGRGGAARIVADALQHFDGERYRLWAWCVMPNHVHVVVEPAEGHALPQLQHTWKSYTAKAINAHLGRSGTLRQPEYFDHLVRSLESFERFVRYVYSNPEAAGLVDWPWRGVHPSLLDRLRE
jgi:REP element-mobilizing transposase RayT